jgi:hypothetical protein
MIRATLEKLARGWAFPRRLPRTVGGSRIWISPDARLRLLQPGTRGFDKGLLDCASVLVQPGHKVWDIGANVGVFAFAAAGRAGSGGRVLAVEPDPWLFGLLQRSRAAPRAGGLGRSSSCVLPSRTARASRVSQSRDAAGLPTI